MASITPATFTPAQEKSIQCIRARALAAKRQALDDISHVFRMSNVPEATQNAFRETLRSTARVAVHFHPDRLVGECTVSEGLLADGIYRSQFETGISNGSVSAFAGGPRDQWERDLFEGNYHVPGVQPSHRPKYGALDLVRNSDGPSPRFGSCYFFLQPHVTQRTTFTYGGSQDSPSRVGTIDEFDAVQAALLAECFSRDFAVGLQSIRPAQLIKCISAADSSPPSLQKAPSRNLDHFIEAQIHGPICLDRDVELLVVDPCFVGSKTWDDCESMGRKYGFPVHTNAGFHMQAADVPPDFRGPTMPLLAERIAVDGVIDARAIGLAVQGFHKNPAAWSDRGSVADVLQELKLLWHVLVRYGATS